MEGSGTIATLEWVDWFNHRRLFGPIGDIPPVEFEALSDGVKKLRPWRSDSRNGFPEKPGRFNAC